MIRMMKTSGGFEAARDAAYKRIGELERERHAAVVKKIGEDKARRVLIMANGVLWCHDGGGNHVIDHSLWRELHDKGVDTGPQWTHCPPHARAVKEDWENAGRRLEAKNE